MIIAAVFLGIALGRGGLGVIDLDPTSGFVAVVAVIALVLLLFRDGIEVEEEMLRSEWHLPLRKLVLAMPITACLAAVACHALTDLNWTESFLVGALLTPTDPVLSSSVITNPRVPRLIRHSLNLESGMNDGLALPAVLAFAAALDAGESDFVWWEFVLQDVTIGLATGVLVGYVAARLLPKRIPALLPVAVAGIAYGIAVLPPHGNGLIAAFVSAIVLGVRRPDVHPGPEGLFTVTKLGVFFVFGTLLTFKGLFMDGPAAVALVAFLLLVARPVAVFAALAGTRTDLPTRAFMAWFGPKGVATMTFALLVLAESGIAARERIFDLAALTVLISIVAHGLTDAPGANWIARRSARLAEGAGQDST